MGIYPETRTEKQNGHNTLVETIIAARKGD